MSCTFLVFYGFIPCKSQLLLKISYYFSRNQLSYLPDSLCQLPSLEVLIVNNNRLVSLPEEIGKMQFLSELDASCNEITHLPVQIGDMTHLRSLNLRRNHLQEIPVGMYNFKSWFICLRV